jgi:glycosyltransferase involved in cell wall biosynthesis
MISVIIPSYKDPYLHKTIQSILDSFTGEFEIIVVLDGYWTEVVDDPRVRVVHLGKNRGMREAINAGVRVAKGEFIMRTDEHCMFAPRFDQAMTEEFEDNWIMTARRFFLDPVKWEVMDLPPVDYEKLKVRDIGNGAHKFEGVVWHSRTKERADKLIDETMAMQGSMWMMKKSWWKQIGELETEGYGTMYQDSHEMVFKTWKLGGKLMVNKKTWFAHKHVSFPRTHQYSREVWEPCVQFAYNTWKDYYQEVREKWHV